MGDDGQAPMRGLVDGDENEVLAEHVKVLRPAGHQRMSLLFVALLQQLRVEHAAEGMDAILEDRGQVEHQMLHPQVDKIVVEVYAR